MTRGTSELTENSLLHNLQLQHRDVESSLDLAESSQSPSKCRHFETLHYVRESESIVKNIIASQNSHSEPLSTFIRATYHVFSTRAAVRVRGVVRRWALDAVDPRPVRPQEDDARVVPAEPEGAGLVSARSTTNCPCLPAKP